MPQISRSKYLVQAGWDDVPHIDEATKADLLASTPPHLRDARSKGIPSLGSGAVYPVSVEQITVEPFSIPAHWKRGYALDVGWNKTAAIWGAQDPTDGVLYAYAEHYQGQQQAIVHAAAIKARGGWMRGAIDPASRGRSQSDGTQLLSQYEDAGLNLSMAKNNVEAGLHLVWTLLSTGQLKLLTTLQNTIAEYRVYQRDENGKVKKQNDHAMDALRYLCMTWDVIGRTKPALVEDLAAPFRPSDARAGY